MGSVEGYTSPFAPWAVRYANEKEGGGSASAGLNVWLTPRLAAPHLSVYVGVRGGVATFMADALPRRDLASHPDDVRRFYTGGGAACACKRAPDLSTSRSTRGTLPTRAVRSRHSRHTPFTPDRSQSQASSGAAKGGCGRRAALLWLR